MYPITSGNAHTHAYTTVLRQSSNHDVSNDHLSNSINHQDIPTKIYCIVAWRIITHLLLAYCVICVTYLLLTNKDCTCKSDDVTSYIPTQSTSTADPTLHPIEDNSHRYDMNISILREEIMETNKITINLNQSIDETSWQLNSNITQIKNVLND